MKKYVQTEPFHLRFTIPDARMRPVGTLVRLSSRKKPIIAANPRTASIPVPVTCPLNPASSPMLCPTCSTEVPADSAFCPKCGAALKQPATAPSTPADRLRAAAPAGATAQEAEQNLWRGGYSAKAMYGSWLVAAVITVVAAIASVLMPIPPIWLAAGIIVAVLWLTLLGKYFVARLSDDYTLTTQRLMNRHGILRQQTDRIEVIDIDDVTFVQGIVERMFGVGMVKVISSDKSHPVFYLRGIDDVQRVANLIDNARREERRKRGLYMESV